MVNFVLDIETIPRDLRAEPRKLQEYVWERALGGRRAHEVAPGLTLDGYLAAPEAPEAAVVRERLQAFMGLRPEFGHVICIGMGHDARGALERRALTARRVEDERRILEEFWETVRPQKEWRLVTYNGLVFDVPYLLRRSLYLGVAPSRLLPLRRYLLEAHYDVMQVLANWERSEAVRLSIVAALLGLAKVPEGMEGSQVYGLWQAGRIDEIEVYCLGDVQLIYEVFLRVQEYFR